MTGVSRRKNGLDRKKRPRVYAQVDEKFYDYYRKQCGGTLPRELLDRNGQPRRPTTSRADRMFVEQWLAIKQQDSRSRATDKTVTACVKPCALATDGSKNGAPPPTQQLDEAKRKSCRVSKLNLAVKGRDFSLRIEPLQANQSPLQNILEVTSGSSSHPREVTVNAKMAAGPCSGTHKGKVLDTGGYPSTIKGQSDSQMKFDVCSEDLTLQLQNDPMGVIWPARIKPHVYNVYAHSCGDQLTAVVKAYSDLNWSLKIPLNLSRSKTTEVSPDSHRKTLTERTVTKERSRTFEVSVKHNGAEYKIEDKFSRKLEDVLSVAQQAVKISDYMVKGLSKLSLGETTITYPSLYISGSCGWKEIPGKWNCGYAYDIGFSADPLFGWKFEYDITMALLRLLDGVAGLGEVLIYAKKAVEEGYDSKSFKAKARLGIYFTANGEIAGFLGFKKEPTDAQGSPQGEIEAKEVYLQISGVVEGEVSVKCFYLEIKLGGAAEIGARAEFTGKVKASSDQNGIYADIQLRFEGLYIYYIAYFEVGGGYVSLDKEKTREYNLRHEKKTGEKQVTSFQYLRGDKDAKRIGKPIIEEKEFKHTARIFPRD